MAEDDIREERLHKQLVTRDVYFFIDTERGIKQKSREVFTNKDLEIHYPIDYNGGPKYKHAKKFSYEGFNGDFPVGTQKSVNYGFGFTYVLKCFIEYIETNLKVTEIVFRPKGKSALNKSKKQLILAEPDLRNIYDAIKSLLDRQKAERLSAAEEQLHLVFPKQVAKGDRP